jgi:hypothetical protein
MEKPAEDGSEYEGDSTHEDDSIQWLPPLSMHGTPIVRSSVSYYPDGTVQQWTAEFDTARVIPPPTYDQPYGGFGTPALPPPAAFESKYYGYTAYGSLDAGSLVELHNTDDPSLNLYAIMTEDRRLILDTDRLPDEFADVIDGGGRVYFPERIDPDGFYVIRVQRRGRQSFDQPD